MKKIYLDVKVVANNEVRNVAFAQGINRTINLNNVEKILAIMKVKGYRKAEMVQVIKAEEAIKTGDIVLVDINGKEIAPSEAANYFLVVDGQHRTPAVRPHQNTDRILHQRRTQRSAGGVTPLPCHLEKPAREACAACHRALQEGS